MTPCMLCHTREENHVASPAIKTTTTINAKSTNDNNEQSNYSRVCLFSRFAQEQRKQQACPATHIASVGLFSRLEDQRPNNNEQSSTPQST